MAGELVKQVVEACRWEAGREVGEGGGGGGGGGGGAGRGAADGGRQEVPKGHLVSIPPMSSVQRPVINSLLLPSAHAPGEATA